VLTVTSPTTQSWWFNLANNTLSFSNKGAFGTWGADIYCLVQGSVQFYGQNLVPSVPVNQWTYTFTIPSAWISGRYFVRIYGFPSGSGPYGTPAGISSQTFTIDHLQDASQQEGKTSVVVRFD
jgi:hypothetical protein